MTEELFRELELVYSINYDFKRYFLPNINKLYTTRISQKTLATFEDKMKSLVVNGPQKKPEFESDLRLLMLSGHDDNIWPFMRAFKITSPECLEAKYKATYSNFVPGATYKEDPECRLGPSFASSFIFELSYLEGKDRHEAFFVKVKYNGSDLSLKKFCPNSIQDVFCPYPEFKKHLEKNLILDDYSFG